MSRVRTTPFCWCVRSTWRAIGRWRGFGLGHPCMSPAKQRRLKILLNTAAIGIAAYLRPPCLATRENVFARVVRVRSRPRACAHACVGVACASARHARPIANPARVCPGVPMSGACHERNARATTIKRTSELLEPSGAGLGQRLARLGRRLGQRCRGDRSQHRCWDRHVNGIVQGAIHILLAQRRRCGGGTGWVGGGRLRTPFQYTTNETARHRLDRGRGLARRGRAVRGVEQIAAV